MRFLILVFVLSSFSSFGQQLYPTLVGTELMETLAEEYTPEGLLSYAKARDTMYQKVYRDENGMVTCYYTGFSKFLPLDVDPSSFLYGDDSPTGMTAEHIYPQSKGAGKGDARSDMHSLFPAIWRANEARSNYPFGEINDTETDHWYFQNEDNREIPTNSPDAYSEKLNGGWGTPGIFEPRESVKGDVARAVFYFYTMYTEKALEADPEFFEAMRPTLMTWHLADPIDETEKQRNTLKAIYQGGKENPYILDCTLVQRVFGTKPGDVENCAGLSSNTKEDRSQSYYSFEYYPNPATSHITISQLDENVSTYITDILGHTRQIENSNDHGRIDISFLNPGSYILSLTKEGQTIQTSKLIKL